MSAFRDPFDPDVKLSAAGCGCGRHAGRAEHDADLAAQTNGSELPGNRVIESAVMRALFPHDAARRNFIMAVGATTAMAAVSAFFPLGAAAGMTRPMTRADVTEMVAWRGSGRA